MNDENNTNDTASENTAASTEPTNVETPTTAPAPESSPTTEAAAPEVPAPEAPAATTTEAAVETAPVAAEPTKVKVTFKGATTSTAEVDVGSPLSAAIKAAGLGTGNSYRSSDGKDMTQSVMIMTDMEISVVTRSRMG